MLFPSLTFLTLFLPIVLGLYLLLRGRARNLLLLVASLLFYSWGSGIYVLVLLGSGLVTWWCGRAVSQRIERDQRTTGLVVAGAAVLLSPLIWFKYASWFSANIAAVADAVGLPSREIDPQTLPIGISFFTFQALSYLFDVQKGTAPPQRKLSDFLLYLALFPQLIAGPIVRYGTIAHQLSSRVSDPDRITVGLQRFVHGLAKKVLVADAVAGVVDSVFGTANPSTLAAWVGVIAYAVQIYFDFSGYSDMAIGLGKIFGFDFPENFARPYSSLSITDFWRRWHITLSEWFRDYVYIPLGGNRVGASRHYVNLIAVFALTALWHGAAWTFIVWGGLHALLLVVERLTGRNHTSTCRFPAVARARTALLILSFWVVFRATSLSDAATIWKAMFTWQGAGLSADQLANLHLRAVAMIVLGAATFFFPRNFSGFIGSATTTRAAVAAARPVLSAVVLVASLAFISTGSLSPFLYFQF